MDHEPVLISTIAVGLMAAFVGGFLAKRIGLPTIVGYIVAGVLLGPFTPGLSADVDIAIELADIGIILLMFGVGIHFSLRDLAAVRGIAIPGAQLSNAGPGVANAVVPSMQTGPPPFAVIVTLTVAWFSSSSVTVKLTPPAGSSKLFPTTRPSKLLVAGSTSRIQV